MNKKVKAVAGIIVGALAAGTVVTVIRYVKRNKNQNIETDHKEGSVE